MMYFNLKESVVLERDIQSERSAERGRVGTIVIADSVATLEGGVFRVVVAIVGKYMYVFQIDIGTEST